MKRLALLVFAAALIVLPASRAAQSAESPKSAKVENEPGEDDMLGWKWANFALLVVILVWLGNKYGNPYFANQTQIIRQGLDEARRHREDAERRSAEVQSKLDNIGQEIEKFRRTALAEQSAEMERQSQKMRAEMEAAWAGASQQIETLGKHARRDLRHFASSLALELAEQRIRQRMSPAIQATLTGDFVEKLKA
jgi:F0F1-type ATP synthase membrane subunit b/b'